MNNTDIFPSRTSLLRRSKASGCEGWMGIRRLFVAFAVLLWFGVIVTRADTHYVAQGSQTPAGDYLDWASAASNIQDAISKAAAGDTVLVSNGVYQTGGVANWPSGTVLTNRVAITNAITVRSANNDPMNTIIKGAWNPGTTNGPAAVRCVYMVNGSSLIGFTLTNGATLAAGAANDKYGAGVWCQSTNTIISNYVIAGNSAKDYGGGAYYGAMYNCTLTGNTATYGGGAMYATLYNCISWGNNMGDLDHTPYYSCGVNYSGDNNIANNPQFVDTNTAN